MRSKPWLTTSLLLLFILLENLCLYYFFRLGMWTTGKNAICLFLSSLLFGFVFLYKFYNVQVDIPETGGKYKWLSWFTVAALVLGLVWLGTEYNDFFLRKKVEFAGSDVILLIQVACRRLLAGEYVYNMVPDFGCPQDMTYLPLHWMPLCLSRMMGIDDRWIPYICWCIAAVVVCIRAARISDPIIKAMVPVLLFVSNYILFRHNNSVIEATVELMIASYYMLLIVGLNTGRGVFLGMILGCCLLSRYSVLLWLPLYAFVLYTTGNRRQLYVSGGIAAAMVLLIYIVPFLSRDPGIFYNGYKYYDKAAAFEWTHISDETGKPIQLFAGTGFAYYFYTRFAEYPIAERIKLLQKTHILVCLASTFLMSLWYRKHKDKIDVKLFLLGSFKIYMSLFLFLIQVPYGYLMCVGNFISIVLFCEQERYRVQCKKA